MKILLDGDEHIRLEPGPPPLTIEADRADRSYSSFQMLASALATCSWSVLASWAEQAELDTTGLAIDVRWEFVDDPHRVGRMQVELDWPGLPEARKEAARRVMSLCAVHQTLHHSPRIDLTVRR